MGELTGEVVDVDRLRRAGPDAGLEPVSHVVPGQVQPGHRRGPPGERGGGEPGVRAEQGVGEVGAVAEVSHDDEARVVGLRHEGGRLRDARQRLEGRGLPRIRLPSLVAEVALHHERTVGGVGGVGGADDEGAAAAREGLTDRPQSGADEAGGHLERLGQDVRAQLPQGRAHRVTVPDPPSPEREEGPAPCLRCRRGTKPPLRIITKLLHIILPKTHTRVDSFITVTPVTPPRLARTPPSAPASKEPVLRAQVGSFVIPGRMPSPSSAGEIPALPGYGGPASCDERR